MAFISTEEAAAQLKISGRHVRWLIDKGLLPAQQVGRAYIIDEAALATVQLPGRGWPRGKARGKREKGE